MILLELAALIYIVKTFFQFIGKVFELLAAIKAERNKWK